MSKLRFALLGCGHWGPNYARLLQQHPKCGLQICVDADPERRAAMAQRFPQTEQLASASELWERDLEAVIIATPASSHYALTQQALQRGWHVLCEKPLALSAAECAHLTQLAEQEQCQLMIGHTFLYHAGLQAIRTYLQQGQLGKLYYLHATRTNLGPVRQDVNALLDLAAHDISIFNALLGCEPEWVTARGQAYLQTGVEDLAFITLNYPGNILAHAHVSWLYPLKIRQVALVGHQKTVLWDDLNRSEPLKIYEMGLPQEPYYQDFGQFQLLPQQGAVHLPRLEQREPLHEVLEAFVNAIQSGQAAFSDGHFATGVGRCLDALQKSLRQQGAAVRLSVPDSA